MAQVPAKYNLKPDKHLRIRYPGLIVVYNYD